MWQAQRLEMSGDRVGPLPSTLQHVQGDRVGPHHFTYSSIGRDIGQDLTTSHAETQRPTSWTKPMEFRTRLGIRRGGVAIRVDELYFPRDRQSTPNHDISKFKVGTPLGNRTRDLMICRLVC